MIEIFTPSITAREWGTGVATAGGGDAGFDFQGHCSAVRLAARGGQPRRLSRVIGDVAESPRLVSATFESALVDRLLNRTGSGAIICVPGIGCGHGVRSNRQRLR